MWGKLLTILLYKYHYMVVGGSTPQEQEFGLPSFKLLISAGYAMLYVHTWLRDDIGGSTPQEHESFFLVDKIINLPGSPLLVQISVTEHPLFLCVCLSCSPPPWQLMSPTCC